MLSVGLLFPLAGITCLLCAVALFFNAGWNLLSGRTIPFTKRVMEIFLGAASIMGGILLFIIATSGKTDDFVRQLTGPDGWTSWLFLLALILPHLLWLAVFRTPLRAAVVAVVCVIAATPEFRSLLAAA